MTRLSGTLGETARARPAATVFHAGAAASPNTSAACPTPHSRTTWRPFVLCTVRVLNKDSEIHSVSMPGFNGPAERRQQRGREPSIQHSVACFRVEIDEKGSRRSGLGGKRERDGRGRVGVGAVVDGEGVPARARDAHMRTLVRMLYWVVGLHRIILGGKRHVF